MRLGRQEDRNGVKTQEDPSAELNRIVAVV